MGNVEIVRSVPLSRTEMIQIVESGRQYDVQMYAWIPASASWVKTSESNKPLTINQAFKLFFDTIGSYRMREYNDDMTKSSPYAGMQDYLMGSYFTDKRKG